MKKTGTKDEVWAATAQQTPGKLTKAGLMQHAKGKKQQGTLVITNRKTPGSCTPTMQKGTLRPCTPARGMARACSAVCSVDCTARCSAASAPPLAS